jgi:outer membrane autotransporter protein
VSSYQGGAYAGWAGGPWYALGSVVASFNEFGTSRLLTPFGLPGDATSSPSGQSYQGHAEAGYHWGVPAAGVNVSVTPYAALDYVNAHLQGFSETGGLGALSVNAADANSLQTTLGVRLTSRIAMGKYRRAHSRASPRLEPRIPRRLAKDYGLARRRCGKRLLLDRHRLRPRRGARGRRLQHGALPRRQGLRRL